MIVRKGVAHFAYSAARGSQEVRIWTVSLHEHWWWVRWVNEFNGALADPRELGRAGDRPGSEKYGLCVPLAVSL